MEPDEQPKGTLAVLLIFLAILALSWGGMYLLLVSRGGG